jgi:hypothetical protein
MDFSLSEEQIMLKNVARDFLDKECTRPAGKPLGLWEGIEEQRVPDWFERFVRGEGVERGSK